MGEYLQTCKTSQYIINCLAQLGGVA